MGVRLLTLALIIKIMDAQVLEIISDYDHFVAGRWQSFTDVMMEKGFTHDDVEKMGERLTEFLTDNKMR
ncbi:hypothetical protein LCGC14_0278020 [marine sediment metagenome]|uniref:Uncharacterized protein n=1 Tax=marine sediment metagenome TaxID=412755 RepID=A0A0F9UDM3_9ZZZZ